jgi:hypothetical protein
MLTASDCVTIRELAIMACIGLHWSESTGCVRAEVSLLILAAARTLLCALTSPLPVTWLHGVVRHLLLLCRNVGTCATWQLPRSGGARALQASL